VPESSGKAHFAIACWIASPIKNERIRYRQDKPGGSLKRGHKVPRDAAGKRSSGSLHFSWYWNAGEGARLVSARFRRHGPIPAA
jgi:hypothetical protein